jgi:hypothetical protein
VSLHINKGLAGAPVQALQASKDTAMNPAVPSAFALAIIAAEEAPAYPGIPGHQPHILEGREDEKQVKAPMAELRTVVPEFPFYVPESNFFEKQWQSAFWGGNHSRLMAAKVTHDPQGLFYVHHGVGSEMCSADGLPGSEREP